MANKKAKTQRAKKLPAELLQKLRSVKGKRAKRLIKHIRQHGYVTTEELSEKYGYDHPPRVARDVREQGIPLETFRIKGTHGRSIAAYKFGDLTKIKGGRLGGRTAWSKKFKDKLVQIYRPRCAVCLTEYEPRYLQIDHRVPYEVGGDPEGELDPSDFMLLCTSCNRAKSRSCEHCKNWKQDHVVNVCRTCYWGSPEKYAHIALRLIRRLDVTWAGNEVPEYEGLVRLSKHARKKLPQFVKDVLRRVLAEESQ